MNLARFVAIESRRMRPDRMSAIKATLYLMIRENPGMTAYMIARSLLFGRASFSSRERVLALLDEMEASGMIGRHYGAKSEYRDPVRRRRRAKPVIEIDMPDEWMLDQISRKRERDIMRGLA